MITRKEVWLKAYIKQMGCVGYQEEWAIKSADKCLAAFDKRFPLKPQMPRCPRCNLVMKCELKDGKHRFFCRVQCS